MKKFRLLGIALIFLFIYTPALFAGDALLTWGPSPDLTVKGYKIYYGIAPRQYTGSIDVGTNTTATVTVDDRTNKIFYFAATAYDALGNESAYSNEVSKDFTGAADTAAPIISSVNVESILSNGARIAWLTDEPSDTKVEYGLTASYGASTPLDPALTTLHSQTLTGLLPATLYHYRVVSRDAAGNLSASLDRTFTTLALPDLTPPGAPANLTGTAVSSSRINLSWSAASDNVGVAGYRVERCQGSTCTNFVQIATSTGTVYSNTGLAAATAYRYRVRAADAAGNLGLYSNVAGATTLAPEAIPPTVGIATPTTGGTYTTGISPLTLGGTASDNVAVTQVAWSNDRGGSGTATGTTSWTIGGIVLQSGQNLLTITAQDAVGNIATDTLTVTYTPPSSLVAAYDFSEGSGTITNDASGNNHTGTLSGPTWTAAGKSGNALLFNATGAVDLGNPTSLQITGSMTISAWINSSAYPIDDAVVVSKRGAALEGYQLDTTIDSGPRTIGFRLGDPSAGTHIVQYGKTPLALGTWYHVAGVYDVAAQTLRVYLNGVLDNGAQLGVVPASQRNSGTNIFIGKRAAGQAATEFSGIIDGVRIYNRALTQAEIQADMTQTGGTADTAPPTTPANLTGTAVSSSQINLSWSAATDNVGVAGYRIHRNGVQVATSGTPSFSDANLTPSTAYSYTISAYDAAGNVSAASSALSVTTLPPAPIVGTPSASSITATSALLSGPVNPSGAPTSAWLEYGTTTAYGSSTPPVTLTASATLSAPITALIPNTLYHFRLVAQNTGGTARSSDQTFTTAAPPDTTAPISQLKTPVPGSMVKGGVPVQADVSDNVAVVQVSFFVDGVSQNTQQGADLKSVTWTWNTVGLPDGGHRLFIRATDAANLAGNSQEISVTVDNTPPSTPGTPTAAAVLQNQITLSWPPSIDAVLFSGYRVLRNGTVVGTPTTASFIDSGLAPNTSYAYTIVAVDSAGNTSGSSPAFSGKTLPLAPVLGTPTASSITSTSAAFSGSVDPSGASTSAWFEYGTTTAYGTSTPPVTLTASTTIPASLSSLTPGTLYHFRLVAQNAGGTTRGADQTFATAASPDTTAPTAQLKSPLSGGIVKGSVPVQADLSDNIAVVQAALFVDGVSQTSQQGADLKSVAFGWNTAGITDGVHRIFVRATDAAGLTGNSQEITVTVDNNPPTVPGTPAATAIFQDQIRLSWSPSTDSVSPVSYRIVRDGTTLPTAASTASFIDSGLLPNRNYTYAILAVDANGNMSAASPALSVKTLPLAPVIGTQAVSSITSTSAALSGSVIPFGASTAVWFEYGTSTAYGTVTPPANLTASGTVSAPIASLSAGTVYHFRMIAQNEGGKTFGADQTFTTESETGIPPFTSYTLASEPYEWLATPNVLSLLGDDAFTAVPLPFPFPFYGQTYSEVFISTNGLMTFGAGSAAYMSQPIPTAGGPNAYIAPFWRDLYVSARQVTYASSSSEFVVAFTGVRNIYSSLPVFTFEVILRADGTIVIQYDTISSFQNTTIGIENREGTQGIAIPEVASGQAYKFTPVGP